MKTELFERENAPVQTRARMNGKPVFNVPAKSILNLDSGFKHKLLCDGPTFTTGSACAYSCTFCYVEDLMRKNPHWQSVTKQTPESKFQDVVIRREGAISALRRQLTDAKGRPKFNDPSDRRVIYGSPLVDVAANMDLVRETIEVCRTIMTLTNWQIRLLSKSNLLSKIAQGLEEVSPLAKNGFGARERIIYGVSTGTLDDGLSRAFETGTPLVSKRIESLHWLQDNGFRTFGMICPSLPQTDYQKFAREMASAIRADKCEHVWAEVLNARGDSFKRTWAALIEAGYQSCADYFEYVSNDKEAWELYAQRTFRAHAEVYHGQTGPDGLPKFRFLQYVKKNSRPWWAARTSDGAILL
jgi:DNA repair photolyase